MERKAFLLQSLRAIATPATN